MAGRVWTEEQKERARERRAERAAEKAQAAVMPEIEGSPEPPVAPEVRELSPASPLLDEHENARLEEETDKIIADLEAKRRKNDQEVERKRAFDELLLKKKRLAGLIDHQDDIVEFRVNVAPFSNGLTLDGHHYPHGSWVKTTRRVYDSARDIMARSWESEDRAGNPNKKFAQERALYGGIDPMLMERRRSDGTFTLGWDHTVHGISGDVRGERR